MNFFSNPFILDDFGPDLPPSSRPVEDRPADLPANALSAVDLRVELNRLDAAND